MTATHTDQSTHASLIGILSTGIACLLIGGIAGGHMGMTRNDLSLIAAEEKAQQAIDQYQSCRAFVASRDVQIDQFREQFSQFYESARGQKL